MIIYLYNNLSDKSKVNKNLDLIESIEGELLEETSIENPSIEIETSNYANYAYIPEFNRYYFVSDVVVINNNFKRYILSEDYLMTARARGFLNLEGLVVRNEYKYNRELIDGNLMSLNHKDYQIKQFPNRINDYTLLLPMSVQ